LSTTKYKPDVIIWPETALPFFFQDMNDLSKMVLECAKKANSVLIFGSPAYEKTISGTKYYNRTYVYDSKSNNLSYYDKLKLVPFGEYVPIRFLAPLVKNIVGDLGEFETGKGGNVIVSNGLRMGMLICYESIFPHLSSMAKDNGSELFINLTNDAWFGHSSAPYQHFSMAVMRAVENRIPLVRAANTGISGVVDPKGRVKASTDIFVEGIVLAEVTLYGHQRTIYNEFGQAFSSAVSLFVFLCLLFLCGPLLFDLVVNKVKHRHHHPRK
jgi:apolipoprotein N-acyltransferase